MNGDSGAHFELDPRLVLDTAFVADWNLCRVLLMDDTRFPWLILVPRKRGLSELDDLDESGQRDLLSEVTQAMRLLRTIQPCDKLNVGALGNIVRQLHVHVVARRAGDAAWPGPVWSAGVSRRYEPPARDALVAKLRGSAMQS